MTERKRFHNRKFFHILNERARKKQRGPQEEEQFKLKEKYEKLYDQHHADGGGRIKPLIEDE